MEHHLIPERIRQELLRPNSVQVGERQAGGLSGAVVWKAQSAYGPVAVRRWPSAHPSPERLTQIHAAMRVARQRGQSCIPQIYCNEAGGTFSCDGRRLWEVTQWMPGVAEYHQAATIGRLQAALRQLASLHGVWAQATSVPAAVSPTLAQRCERLQAWIERLPELIRRPPLGQAAAPQLWALFLDTTRQLALRGAELLTAALSLREQPVELHFVLRDIWSEHVLFTNEQVTGIVDFGAARVDEPATDVARLLGSLEPMDPERWQQGWEFYREVNPRVDRQRVELLDQVGTLLAALQWLEWLVLEPRQFNASSLDLITRWQRLVSRLESF